MTKEEARKAAEVMLAYAQGENIECLYIKGSDYKFEYVSEPSFNWHSFDYRIKP